MGLKRKLMYSTEDIRMMAALRARHGDEDIPRIANFMRGLEKRSPGHPVKFSDEDCIAVVEEVGRVQEYNKQQKRTPTVIQALNDISRQPDSPELADLIAMHRKGLKLRRQLKSQE